MQTRQYHDSVSDQSRQNGVFEQIRRGILSGALPAGARLPPTRRLADELGVARQTVVLAYERLGAEGYTDARVGSGTFVTKDLPDDAPGQMPQGLMTSTVETPRLSRRGADLAGIDMSASMAAGLPLSPEWGLLAPGVPATELFPRKAWAACTALVLRSLPESHMGYPDPQGLLALRKAICAHLATSRGLIADPGRIVMTSGTQQALRVAADLLIDPGDQVWVEDPGYIAGRAALLAAGACLIAVPSDRDGLDVAAGITMAPAARLVLVAPSHATPFGGALPIGRRIALLDWAGRTGAIVLEDDCDSEFRWGGRPLPPLASLDHAGLVIYCGTFSKTLAPALRIGFAVLPESLVAPFVHARDMIDRGPAVLNQAVLAEFMAQGSLGPHIRRMRTEYAKRRTALLAALACACPSVLAIEAPGGLHLVGRLAAGTDEIAVCAAARARQLLVAPLQFYHVPPRREAGVNTRQFAGIVMGFAGTPVGLATAAARALSSSVAYASASTA